MTTKSADGGGQSDGAEVTLNGVLTVVEKLAASVATLTERVQNLDVTAGQTLPLAQSPEQILSRMKAGQSSSGHKVIDPLGKSGYRPDDVVELIDEERLQLFRQAGKIEPDEPMLGVVQSLMYRRRKDQQRKYKVAFPGIGDDGVMEYDMKMVKAAP